MKIKFIVVLLFAFSFVVCRAQKSKYPPLMMKQKTYSFALPALQIDSAFMANLRAVLFERNDHYMNHLLSRPNKERRHFHIGFEKTDSLHYCVEVSLWDIPARISVGFLEENGYFYWFDKSAPTNIILKKNQKRRFSYKDPISGPYDPPFLYLIYNHETKLIELRDDKSGKRSVRGSTFGGQ